MSELMNPVKLIQWLFEFSQGVIDFMGTNIYIPTIGNMPVWSLFVSALAPLLMFVLIKRLVA